MNNWISVDDRLPEIETANIKEYNRCYSKSVRVLCVCKQKSGKVMVKEGYYETSSDGTRIYWKIPGSIDSVTHWMPLPEPPTGKDELTLIDNNVMIWTDDSENFRCSCGGNVFTKYKTSNNKIIYKCHSCNTKYEGE